MFPRILKVLLLLLLATPAWAACRNHVVTPPEDVRIADDSVMIVVHESSTHDARFSTKRGIDEAVRFAKARKIPVIYLQDETPEEYYFMEDCYPDHWVYSEGGEIRFKVTASHVYIVGGHLELCMSSALHDIILQWSKHAPRNFTVTYLMDAIYSNGKMIEPEDPWYSDFDRFMGIVAYGRPGGEHWPKLNLLETMGIALREEWQMDYVKRILPRWDRTFSDAYRVQLQLNHSMKHVLRNAPGWSPPTVLFRFVESALKLAEPGFDTY